jgi:co-chaperonin GroES (HSP10)
MTKNPVGDKIIISLMDKKEEKIGSVIVPGTANAELLYGKIEAVSNELKEVYKVGDIAIYPKGCGVGQLIDGKPHVWLRALPLANDTEVWGYEKEENISKDKEDSL